jgi:hypothetical protein
LQTLQGEEHALLANPLHGAAVEAFLEGVVDAAARIVALRHQHGQGERLIEIEDDEIDDLLQPTVGAGGMDKGVEEGWGSRRLGKARAAISR